MEKKMFYNAVPPIFKRAQELRSRQTDAEQILWMYLRTKPKGFKFRRQHPAYNYILDFYCNRLRLAIEVDGSIHDEKEIIQNDIERQKNLEAQGLKFARFTNAEIISSLDSVIEKMDIIMDDCFYRISGAGESLFEADDRE